MPKRTLAVRLYGRWGLADLERELARGPVELDLPEAVTGEALMRCVADRLGPRFQRKALKPSGALRAEVRLFIDDEPMGDLAADIGAALHAGAEVSIAWLAPLVGG